MGSRWKSYGLDINLDKVEDVLLHQKLLSRRKILKIVLFSIFAFQRQRIGRRATNRTPLILESNKITRKNFDVTINKVDCKFNNVVVSAEITEFTIIPLYIFN